jgi:hypothetical protein
VACFNVDGLYSGHEVNIGYRPWRTLRQTAIRVARDGLAAVVVELRPGQGLGRQTVRNPDHLDEPADRPPAAGSDGGEWIWVYGRAHGGSGWIALADCEPAVSPPGRPCRGPAGFDFEPGVMPSKHGPHTTCGSRVVLPRRWRRRTVGVDAVYVRYSPDGTAWDYLRHGEQVELVCHGPRGFDGVLSASRGAAGWVEGAALRRS